MSFIWCQKITYYLPYSQSMHHRYQWLNHPHCLSIQCRITVIISVKRQQKQ
uniref:Uncharacterized protein n=2 Tax=Anguilla anguilla TaxID=7936 RepID=A0A0E9RX37_ANGAN